MSLMKSPLHQSFVHPDICRRLANAGINMNTPYIWKAMPDGQTMLFTLAFDVDCYYTNGQQYISEFNPPANTPAFQLGDMEKLLPDYYLERSNGNFKLLCSAWFPDRHFEDTRLPDLLARIVNLALIDGKIHPVMAIEIINDEYTGKR